MQNLRGIVAATVFVYGLTAVPAATVLKIRVPDAPK
jgi:hypothetical protein